MSFLINALRLAAIISPFPFYTYLWYRPQPFVDMACSDGADPSHRMAQISSALKVLQFITLFSTASFASGWFPPLWAIVFFAAGQYLNFKAYQLLGEAGIYYGNRFGKEIPWVKEFPYGTIKDPQYWGSILSLIAVTCWVPWRWILPWIGGYFWMVGNRRRETCCLLSPIDESRPALTDERRKQRAQGQSQGQGTQVKRRYDNDRDVHLKQTTMYNNYKRTE